MGIRSSFVRIAVAAVVIGFVVPTRAATFAVDPATSAGSFALGDEAPRAPLADTFQSGAGALFESSSLATTGEGLSLRDYSLVFGDSGSFFDPSLPLASSRAASIDIAATPPVPEPHTTVLLLTGAVLLVWHLYRRRMDRP